MKHYCIITENRGLRIALELSLKNDGVPVYSIADLNNCDHTVESQIENCDPSIVIIEYSIPKLDEVIGFSRSRDIDVVILGKEIEECGYLPLPINPTFLKRDIDVALGRDL